MSHGSRFAALLIALLGPAAGAAGPVPQMVIELRSYSFAPAPIHLAAGNPVSLTFTNRSGSGHDFTAREFFAASAIVSGAAPAGKIALAGHETRTITLVPRAGSYHVHCSHLFHAQMGMTDEIIVN